MGAVQLRQRFVSGGRAQSRWTVYPHLLAARLRRSVSVIAVVIFSGGTAGKELRVLKERFESQKHTRRLIQGGYAPGRL
jgi:hypothetical protein